jgi:geranylgeranyl diphosphate synthase type I
MSLLTPVAFRQYLPKVEAELESILSEYNLPLYTMMHYHLGLKNHPGKMLRPVLCLLANDMVGGNWQAILPAAVAIELVHNFTLIHDDIEDKSEERRHRQALWKLWGTPQGINTGDAMYSLAQLTLLKLEERGIASTKIVQASRLLAQACLELCEGQYLDIEYENRLDISEADYLKMIDKKTARLFQSSLCLGALLGTDEPNLIEQLGSFGRSLGLAYQIKNDLEGIEDDIRQKKKTLPIIYALNKAEEREKLYQIYQQMELSKGDIAQFLKILNNSAASDYSREMINEYYIQAREAIERLELPVTGKQDLIEIASFLLR